MLELGFILSLLAYIEVLSWPFTFEDHESKIGVNFEIGNEFAYVFDYYICL